MALAGAVALLVLLNAIVAVLVVDLACLLDAEDVVGFGNRDELGIGRLVSAGACQWAYTGDRAGRTGSCPGGTSCSACGRLS